MFETTTSGTGTAVVEGLAEAMALTELTEKEKTVQKIISLKKAKLDAEKDIARAEKAAAKAAEKLEAWKVRTAERNPACLVDTVRSVPAGETLDNGLVSKGRVVEIECQHCGTERTVNVQDAFQTRFCVEHKNVGRKATTKARIVKAQADKLAELSEEELQDELEALQAELEAA